MVFTRQAHILYYSSIEIMIKSDMDKGLLGRKLNNIIELVDNLRDIGLQQIIKLPKIIIVGSQSAGKSSLIEQIVGIDFLPRGKGVVTRRPLQLRLTKDNTINEPFGIFSELPREIFTNFNQVRDKINQLTDKLCGNNKNIIDEPIILNVYSPHCPTITIIDLPGITVNPVGDQPQNIYDITKNLVLKYVKDPRSILVCVIPANQDISTSQALKIVLEADPSGKKSLGCLTKIDIMNPGQNVRQILLNNIIPLKYGYVGIKNRNNQDIIENKSVLKSLQEQKQYFSQSPIYSTLPPDTTGTQALINKITTILHNQIKQLMPHIIKQISIKKFETKSQLNQLGNNFQKTPQQLLNFIWKMISKFLKIYKKSLSGIIDDEIKKQPFGPNIRKLMNQLYQNQYLDKATQNLSDRDIQLAMIKYTSSSIPGFLSVDSFLYLLNPLMAKLISSPLLLIQQVFKQIKKSVVEIANQIVSQKYPLFLMKLTECILKIISTAKQQVKNIITDILDAQINYLYTNDLTYLIGDFSMPQQLRKKYESRSNFNPLVYEFRKRLDALVKITVRNLRDIIPKQISNIILIKATQKIQFQLYNFIRSSNQLKQWFKEPQYLIKQRQAIQYNLRILQSAQKRIKKDIEFGRYILPLKNKKKNNNKQYSIKEDNSKLKTEDKQRDVQIPIELINNKKREVQIVQIQNKVIDKSNNTTQLRDPLSKLKRQEEVFKLFSFKPS